MASRKQFRIKYFRAAFESEGAQGCAVHDALEEVAARGLEERWQDVGPDEIALADYRRSTSHRNPRIWLGEMRRLRIHDRVAEGTRDGEIDDLRLPDGHYISECSYFVMVPRYKAVLYYASHHATSWGQFKRYMHRSSERDEPLLFLPILNRELLEQFRAMRRPRKLRLKIAQPERWSLDPDPPLAETTRTAGDFGAQYLELEMSMGHNRQSLRRDVIGWCQQVLGWGESHPGTLQKAVIEGYLDDEGEERAVIDLITEKLEDTRTFDMDEIRTIEQFRRMAYGTLEQSWDDNRTIVRDSFDQTTQD